MRILKSVGSLAKLVIVAACIYAVVKWGYNELQVDEYSQVAERDCADDVGSRDGVQSVSVYSVRKRDDGYVVHASVRLSRGDPVKFICLTNRYGGVEDISVEGR